MYGAGGVWQGMVGQGYGWVGRSCLGGVRWGWFGMVMGRVENWVGLGRGRLSWSADEMRWGVVSLGLRQVCCGVV